MLLSINVVLVFVQGPSMVFFLLDGSLLTSSPSGLRKISIKTK